MTKEKVERKKVKGEAEGNGAHGADMTAEMRRAARAQEAKEAQRVRRERKAKARADYETEMANRPKPNPLLSLPDEDKAKLFSWLRECPYDDAVLHVLKDQGIGEVTEAQVMEFFQDEAESHWERRIERAALEANALVRLVEKSPVQFSSGILAALGQEAFRQIASGQVEPAAMEKITSLFLKARSSERAEQMQVLQREKLRQQLQGQFDQALEQFSKEVEKHPAAKKAFEELRAELARSMESKEEE